MMPEHFRGICRLIVAIVVFISGGFVVLILHLLTLINIITGESAHVLTLF